MITAYAERASVGCACFFTRPSATSSSTTRLTRVLLVNCRVRSLRLDGATLVDVDLRSAHLQEIHGLAGLAGAWVSEQQLTALAPLLAAHVGLHVGED